MKMCRVVNKYHSDFDVNIHRGTMWGNDAGKDAGSREAAISAFKNEFYNKLRTGEIKREHLETLRGMRLGCTCKPKDCHGDIIVDLYKELIRREESCQK